MMLHMGTTTDRNFYAIEKRGHRDGYDTQVDMTGISPPSDDGAKYWKGCPDVLDTTLDFEDIWTRWRNALLLGSPDAPSELNGVILRPSENAGHFLCDFLYYSNLAEYWRHQKNKGDNDGGRDELEDRPVMFMQVPGHVSGDDLKTGRLVTMGLIRALAESWMAQKRKKGVDGVDGADGVDRAGRNR